ncbi:MAG: hypothetical protein ACOXZI_04015 [Candidatus Cryptobacteroides sp.]
MEGETKGRMLQNSIYQTRRLFVEEIRSSEVSKNFCDALEERLLETLKDLKDISKALAAHPKKRKTALIAILKTFAEDDEGIQSFGGLR